MELLRQRTPDQKGRRVRSGIVNRYGSQLSEMPTILWYGGERYLRPHSLSLHTAGERPVPDAEWFHNRRSIREALKKATSGRQVLVFKGGE